MDQPFFKRPTKPRKIQHSWYPPNRKFLSRLRINDEEITGKAKIGLMECRIRELEKQLNTSRDSLYQHRLKLWQTKEAFTDNGSRINSNKRMVFLFMLSPKLFLKQRQAERYRRLLIISLYSRFKVNYFTKWGIWCAKRWVKRSIERGEIEVYRITGQDYLKLTPEMRRELSRYIDDVSETWKNKGVSWKKLDVM